MRPQNSFPKHSVSPQIAFKDQCHGTVAYWTQCLQFNIALLKVFNRLCLFSCMKSNSSSTTSNLPALTFHFFRRLSLIYLVTSSTQLCLNPLTEDENRAEQLLILVLSYDRKWGNPYTRRHLCDLLRESLWNQSDGRSGHENVRYNELVQLANVRCHSLIFQGTQRCHRWYQLSHAT